LTEARGPLVRAAHVEDFVTRLEDAAVNIARENGRHIAGDDCRHRFIDQRDTMGVRGTLQWNVGRHTVKGGLEWSRNENFRDLLYQDDQLVTSFAPHLSGISAGTIATGSYTAREFNVNNTSDFGGLIQTINRHQSRDLFYSRYDANGDGTISPAELGSRLTFTSTAGNPDGKINYDRVFMSALGSQLTKSKGVSFFAQDQFTFNRVTFNVGLRAERWEHIASTGQNIFTFDWEFAPRLSAAYDLLGDGRQKVFGFYGRYYDPIRNNMTNFAGTLSGFVREEQVFLTDQWVTYRTRGGLVQQDAFFAPTTQTPYTDDLSFGYQVDLGRNMAVESTYTYRRTRDILEDYDLALFALNAAGGTDYPGPIDDPQSLWLGLDYFGYAQNPGSNFVIATLNDGKRNYQGLDLVFRKRHSNNWQLLGSYTYNWAKGNSNSDSNADFQGDVLFLDPLAPDSYKRLPGTIPHVFKVAGSYMWPIGIELGGAFRYNSGTIASKTFLAQGRNLPIEVDDPYEFAGITEFWLAPDAVGSLQNPGWAQLDLRAQYRRRLTPALGAEFFVDIFNVFNNQDSIRDQDLVAGSGGTAFGEPIRFLDPRRFFLGARLTF